MEQARWWLRVSIAFALFLFNCSASAAADWAISFRGHVTSYFYDASHYGFDPFAINVGNDLYGTLALPSDALQSSYDVLLPPLAPGQQTNYTYFGGRLLPCCRTPAPADVGFTVNVGAQVFVSGRLFTYVSVMNDVNVNNSDLQPADGLEVSTGHGIEPFVRFLATDNSAAAFDSSAMPLVLNPLDLTDVTLRIAYVELAFIDQTGLPLPVPSFVTRYQIDAQIDDLVQMTSVPLPSAVLLFLSGFAGLLGLRVADQE